MVFLLGMLSIVLDPNQGVEVSQRDYLAFALADPRCPQSSDQSCHVLRSSFQTAKIGAGSSIISVDVNRDGADLKRGLT